MRHMVLDKRAGYYSAWPVAELLSDGRLAIQILAAPFADHYGLDECFVLVSKDQGETFQRSDDSTIPLGWPGTNPRECNDRYASILPNGDYLMLGTVGFEVWPAERKQEAEERGFKAIQPHPNGSMSETVVMMPRLFVARSRDRGNTWTRREQWVPGFSEFYGFPRWVRLHDGTILMPIMATNTDNTKGQELVFRYTPDTDRWQLISISAGIADARPDETCFFEVSPGRVLALMRHVSQASHTQGYLLESWSDDGGLTWTQPLRTDIKGYPPHLLRLQDGRILCSIGYRWPPMGIRAVLSEEDGKTWDTEHSIILRDDGGTVCSLWANRATMTGGSDVGYPITVQFPDGSLFTVYYITLADGITHVAATKWRLDEVGR